MLRIDPAICRLDHQQSIGARVAPVEPRMDIEAVLTRDLEQLLDGLDRDGLDPGDALAELQQALLIAVPSYLGCRLVVVVDSVAITLVQVGATASVSHAGSTLSVPLTALSADQRSGKITFYAGAPGSLVDLAADLAYALELAPDRAALDDAFDTLPLVPGISGLDDLATINRAIGVLIADGVEPGDALQVLQLRAVAAEGLVITEAQRLLGRPVDSEDTA